MLLRHQLAVASLGRPASGGAGGSPKASRLSAGASRPGPQTCYRKLVQARPSGARPSRSAPPRSGGAARKRGAFALSPPKAATYRNSREARIRRRRVSENRRCDFRERGGARGRRPRARRDSSRSEADAASRGPQRAVASDEASAERRNGRCRDRYKTTRSNKRLKTLLRQRKN